MEIRPDVKKCFPLIELLLLKYVNRYQIKIGVKESFVCSQTDSLMGQNKPTIKL